MNWEPVKDFFKKYFLLLIFTVFVVGIIMVPQKDKEIQITGHMAPSTAEGQKKISIIAKMLEARNTIADVIQNINQTFSSAANLWKGEEKNETNRDWNAWAVKNGYGPLFHEMDSLYGDFVRKELKGLNSKITWQMVISKICTESSGNPDTVGTAGEIGLMQLKPEAGKQFGVPNPEDLYDPLINIKAGIKYLDWLEKKLGSPAAAMVGYHYGHEGARQRFDFLDKPVNMYVDNLKFAGVLKAAGI